MVALNTAYAAPKNAADPKNRVGDFFYEDHASVGENRWASRLNTRENRTITTKPRRVALIGQIETRLEIGWAQSLWHD